jgi:hypothetical protein
MLDKNNEVFFEEYCKTCKYKNYSETDSPCEECIAEPVNLYSHKPVKWEGANGIFSGPPPRPDHAYHRAVKYVPEKRKDKEKAIARQNIDAEYTGNKVQSIDGEITDDQYPSATAVKKALEGQNEVNAQALAKKIDAPSGCKCGEFLAVEEVDEEGVVKKVKAAEVQTDPPDWNENDPTKPGYVKNRPFWDELIEIPPTYALVEEYGIRSADMFSIEVQGKRIATHLTEADDSIGTIENDGIRITLHRYPSNKKWYCDWKFEYSKEKYSELSQNDVKLYREIHHSVIPGDYLPLATNLTAGSVVVDSVVDELDYFKNAVQWVRRYKNGKLFIVDSFDNTMYRMTRDNISTTQRIRLFNSADEYCTKNLGISSEDFPLMLVFIRYLNEYYKEYSLISAYGKSTAFMYSVSGEGAIMGSKLSYGEFYTITMITTVNNGENVYSIDKTDYSEILKACGEKIVRIYDDERSAYIPIIEYSDNQIAFANVTGDGTRVIIIAKGGDGYSAEVEFVDLTPSYQYMGITVEFYDDENNMAASYPYELLMRIISRYPVPIEAKYNDEVFTKADIAPDHITFSGVHNTNDSIYSSSITYKETGEIVYKKYEPKKLPAPTTAQVGQIVKVKAVDADGKVTETEAVDMPTQKHLKWITVHSSDLTEEKTEIVISTDSNGKTIASYNPIGLTLVLSTPADSTQTDNNGAPWVYPSATYMDNTIRVIGTIAGWKTTARDNVFTFIGGSSAMSCTGNKNTQLATYKIDGYSLDGVKAFLNGTSNHFPIGTHIEVSILCESN